MNVSVLIAARDAQATLAQTLDSLLAQSHASWQAIVVDDASRDATAELVRGYVARDARFQLLSGDGQGVAAARNLALSHAQGEWLLFLDSDDWIAPEHLTKMLGALAQQPEAAVCCCAYQRVTPSGELLPPRLDPAIASQPEQVFARSVGAAIHAFVVKRELVVRLCGFDRGLRTCEDWDLWQRVARSGARFLVIPEALAFYRMSRNSLTHDPASMILCARGVIERGFAGLTDAAAGGPGDAAQALFFFSLWVATQAAASGDARPELLCATRTHIDDDLGDFVSTITDALTVGAECTPYVLADHWSTFAPALLQLVDCIAAQVPTPGWKRRLLVALDHRMIAYSTLQRPVVLGTTFALRSDIASPSAIVPPRGIDTLYLQLCSGSTVLHTIEMPLLGRVGRAELQRLTVEALGRRAYWTAVVRAGWKSVRGQRIRPALETDIDANNVRQASLIARAGSRARAAVPVLASALAHDAPARAQLDRTDCQAYWEALFSTPDPWNYGSAYEQEKYRHTLALVPEGRVGSALELACAEGWFTRLLAERVETLIASDISTLALERARQRSASHSNISYRQLDLVADAFPEPLDLITCSEVLYYLRDEAELRFVCEKIAAALAPGGHVLTAHAHIVKDDRSRTAFDWDQPFGAGVIARTFGQASGLVLERSLRTELYQIDLFRRVVPGEPERAPIIETHTLQAQLEPKVARHVIWGGSVTRRAEAWATETTQSLPVLMYHSVSDTGPDELARYRVTPSAFREQMRWLRRHGYYAVSPGQVAEHFQSWKPFAGRPVLITFDDGTADFAETAWPIVRDHDLSATNFIVTGHVGADAVWDQAYGAPTKLMTWQQIAAAGAEGASFGSHTVNHLPVDALPSEALIDELAGSAATLAARLGTPCEAFAAPYGIVDARTLRLLWPCGYRVGFTTRHGIAKLGDSQLSLPRIEVTGAMDLTAFAHALRGPEHDTELVSVIIPAYNGAATIDETLRSVRAQSHSRLEILVIDDGSSDHTPQIVEQHASADSRVKLLRQNNAGVAAARNFGIEQAKAELLAFVDADDLWSATKIERQLRALKAAGPRAGLAYTWFAVIDEQGAVVDTSSRPTECGDVLERVCFGNLVGNGSSALVTRAALRKVGGFDPSLRSRKAQGCEDLQFYFRVAEHYDFALVPEHLTGYRRMPGNMSSDLLRMLRSRLLVSDEMIARQPQFEQTVRRGDLDFIVWLLGCAIEERRMPEIAQLSAQLLKRPPVDVARAMRGNVGRLTSAARRRAGPRAAAPRFVIGVPVTPRSSR